MIDPKSLSNWTPYALAVLRIVAGLIFLEHGTQKLLGFPSGERAFVDAMTCPGGPAFSNSSWVR
jgi:putative oxidoreductase